jgi:hypothetical protein
MMRLNRLREMESTSTILASTRHVNPGLCSALPVLKPNVNCQSFSDHLANLNDWWRREHAARDQLIDTCRQSKDVRTWVGPCTE